MLKNYSEFIKIQTPRKIQKLLCINVFKLALNTQLLSIEFPRFEVT